MNLWMAWPIRESQINNSSLLNKNGGSLDHYFN